MAGTTTTYLVETIYKTRNESSGPLKAIEGSANRASRSMGGLTSSLRGVATALAGYGVLRAGAQAFVGFNSSIEKSTISLAAQEKLLLGGRWDVAMGHANQLFEDYQQVAKNSVGETKDFLDMHAGIAASAYRAGIGMQQLKEMTIGATIAAAALGERADMVSLDVKQMLSGDVTSRDRTAQVLLASQNVTAEAFNKMTTKRRNAIVLAALNDPALKSAAKAMGESFAGVTSTLKDNLQIAAGKIGLPLFKAITAEVQKWNAWIEKNPEKIRQFAADFTNALMKGFEMVQKIASFVVDNRELLMSLAKAYLVSKGVGAVVGGLSGVGNITGLLAKIAGSGPGSLGAFASALTLVTAPLAAAAIAAPIIADDIAARQERRVNAQGDWAVLNRGAKEYSFGEEGDRLKNSREMRQADLTRANRMLTQAGDIGFLVQGKTRKFVNSAAIATSGVDAGMSTQAIQNYIDTLNKALNEESKFLRTMSAPDRQAMYEKSGLPEAFALGADLWSKMTIKAWGAEMDAGVSNKVGLIFSRALSLVPGFGGMPNVNDPTDAKKIPKIPAANVNVEVTVISDDPDRFSMDLGALVHDALRNPGASRHVFREGGS